MDQARRRRRRLQSLAGRVVFVHLPMYSKCDCMQYAFGDQAVSQSVLQIATGMHGHAQHSAAAATFYMILQ